MNMKSLFGSICFLPALQSLGVGVFLVSFVAGCGASYKDQIVDKDNNVIATTSETDIGYWGIDSKSMTPFDKCMVEKRNLPGGMGKAMCTQTEVVEHSRDLNGEPMHPASRYYHRPNPYMNGY
jgi:hypothetical protein